MTFFYIISQFFNIKNMFYLSKNYVLLFLIFYNKINKYFVMQFKILYIYILIFVFEEYN